MTRRAMPAWALAALSIALAAAVASGGGSATAANEKDWPLTKKTILFASDGMRPDLVDKYASQGVMPTMAGLMSAGVKGQNGLLQGFPPNTGVGWATLATRNQAQDSPWNLTTIEPRGDSSVCSTAEMTLIVVERSENWVRSWRGNPWLIVASSTIET